MKEEEKWINFFNHSSTLNWKCPPFLDLNVFNKNLNVRSKPASLSGYHLTKNSRNLGWKSKWCMFSNFRKGLFRDCPLNPEAVLFFCLEISMQETSFTICWILLFSSFLSRKKRWESKWFGCFTWLIYNQLIQLIDFLEKKPFHYSIVIPRSLIEEMVSTPQTCTK